MEVYYEASCNVKDLNILIEYLKNSGFDFSVQRLINNLEKKKGPADFGNCPVVFSSDDLEMLGADCVKDFDGRIVSYCIRDVFFFPQINNSKAGYFSEVGGFGNRNNG